MFEQGYGCATDLGTFPAVALDAERTRKHAESGCLSLPWFYHHITVYPEKPETT